MSHKSWIAQPKENPNSKEKPWEVKRENAERASKDFKTQKKAWNYAQELALKHATTQNPAKAKLKLKRDGTFSEIERYPRSSDGDERRF